MRAAYTRLSQAKCHKILQTKLDDNCNRSSETFRGGGSGTGSVVEEQRNVSSAGLQFRESNQERGERLWLYTVAAEAVVCKRKRTRKRHRVEDVTRAGGWEMYKRGAAIRWETGGPGGAGVTQRFLSASVLIRTVSGGNFRARKVQFRKLIIATPCPGTYFSVYQVESWCITEPRE